MPGCFFVDRDPHMFRHILNFHRGQNVPVPHLCNADLAQLADDSAFYGLPRLEEVVRRELKRRGMDTADDNIEERRMREFCTFRPGHPHFPYTVTASGPESSSSGSGNSTLTSGTSTWRRRATKKGSGPAVALGIRPLAPGLGKVCRWGVRIVQSAKANISIGVVRASILTAAPSGGAFDGWWCFHAGSHRPSGYAYDRYCVWVPDNIIPRVPTSDSPGLASFDPPVESAVTTSTATSVTNSTTAVATTPGTSTTPKTPCKKRPVTRVAEGSIVKVAVEVDSGVISFGVDDSDYAVAYSGVDVHSEPLFPCVIMYDDGDTVELVPPEEFDFA